LSPGAKSPEAEPDARLRGHPPFNSRMAMLRKAVVNFLKLNVNTSFERFLKKKLKEILGGENSFFLLI